jgi:hypothetical protein
MHKSSSKQNVLVEKLHKSAMFGWMREHAELFTTQWCMFLFKPRMLQRVHKSTTVGRWCYLYR